jgi:hypothetical protein
MEDIINGRVTLEARTAGKLLIGNSLELLSAAEKNNTASV